MTLYYIKQVCSNPYKGNKTTKKSERNYIHVIKHIKSENKIPLDQYRKRNN